LAEQTNKLQPTFRLGALPPELWQIKLWQFRMLLPQRYRSAGCSCPGAEAAGVDGRDALAALGVVPGISQARDQLSGGRWHKLCLLGRQPPATRRDRQLGG